MAAVIILAMTEGRAGLKDLVSQMGRWRVGFTWYAVAISLPISYGLCAAGLNLLFGANMGELDPWNNLLLLIPLFLLLGGQWEEPGWTGYALPRLQVGRSAIAASLILSVLRLGWHLPLFFYGAITWADTVFIIAMQFVVTWLYNSTHGSVFVVMVLHLMQNVSGGFFNPAFSGDDAVDYAWLRAALCGRRHRSGGLDRGGTVTLLAARLRSRIPASGRRDRRPSGIRAEVARSSGEQE